jgi:hypothetical protein
MPQRPSVQAARREAWVRRGKALPGGGHRLTVHGGVLAPEGLGVLAPDQLALQAPGPFGACRIPGFLVQGLPDRPGPQLAPGQPGRKEGGAGSVSRGTVRPVPGVGIRGPGFGQQGFQSGPGRLFPGLPIAVGQAGSRGQVLRRDPAGLQAGGQGRGPGSRSGSGAGRARRDTGHEQPLEGGETAGQAPLVVQHVFGVRHQVRQVMHDLQPCLMQACGGGLRLAVVPPVEVDHRGENCKPGKSLPVQAAHIQHGNARALQASQEQGQAVGAPVGRPVRQGGSGVQQHQQGPPPGRRQGRVVRQAHTVGEPHEGHGSSPSGRSGV